MRSVQFFFFVLVVLYGILSFNEQLANSSTSNAKGYLYKRASSSNGTSDNSTLSSDPDSAGDVQQDPACNQSSDLAMFLLRSPNMSSTVFLIGQNMSIVWSYTKNIKVVPSNITIYYQNVDWKLRWNEAATISGGGTKSYTWKVPTLAAGSYRLKLVANGKDNTVQPADDSEVVCYGQGEVIATISRAFKLTDDTIPDSTTNPYAPNNFSPRLVPSALFVSLVTVILCSLF